MSVMDRVRDGDLYALLALCSTDDLDPIVKVLMGASTNRLKHNPVYKAHAPNHCMYHKEIGDNLRLFGGNTLRNLSRRGEGPSYGDIVLNVCRRLNSPYKAGDVVGNELTLLTLYMQRQWDGLSDTERAELIATARSKASASADNLVKRVKSRLPLTFSLSMLLAPTFLALPLLAVGFRSTGPAYQVTAPCVLHIAFLRRKLMDAEAPTAGTHVAGSGTEASPDSTGLMIFGESDDRPLLSLMPVGTPVHGEGWQYVAADDNGISRLNPLLQALPSVAAAAEAFGALGATYYRVVADGPLMQSSTAGAFRGLVAGPAGIQSQANLFKPEQLQAILGPAALLQIASVIVGQAHLADISKKLKRISEAVGRIALFQQEGRHASIMAAIEYFREVAAPILRGELDASVRAQLEAAERELLAFGLHIEQELKNELSQFARLKDEAMVGSTGLAAAIRTAQSRLTDLNEQHLLCLRARICGLLLLAAFPNTASLQAARLEKIGAGLGSAANRDTRLAEVATLMRDKIDQMSSAWNMMATNKVKLELLAWNTTFASNVTAGFDEIVRAIGQVDRRLLYAEAPAAVIAKVQDGRIVAMCAEPLAEPAPA